MHPDSPHPFEPLIGEAVHLLIHIAKTEEGSRRIKSVVAVNGYADGKYCIQDR